MNVLQTLEIQMKEEIFKSAKDGVSIEIEYPNTCRVYLEKLEVDYVETGEINYYKFSGEAYILTNNSCGLNVGSIVNATSYKRGAWTGKEQVSLVKEEGYTNKVYKVSMPFNDFRVEDKFIGCKITNIDFEINKKVKENK